jgi:xanthine dehydrogenase iron-sulfur cluster and FAD-binding subunit A
MTACWVKGHPEVLKTHTMRELMAGNLCRCTGYDGILDGMERMCGGTPHHTDAASIPRNAP